MDPTVWKIRSDLVQSKSDDKKRFEAEEVWTRSIDNLSIKSDWKVSQISFGKVSHT